MIRPGSIHEAILAAILLILMAILGILRVILKKKAGTESKFLDQSMK